MIIALAVVFLVYDLGMIVLIYGLGRVGMIKTPAKAGEMVSVLVPVRNEEVNIKSTLQSILLNNHADFEVLVIDDHSQDRTLELVEAIDDARVRAIQLGSSQYGKKAAIHQGVKEAVGGIILCTDGDTEVGGDWIQRYAGVLSERQLAFGSVRYRQTGGWYSMINMELSALVGVGAATLMLGKAGMINGCNYGFRKDAFEAVRGFEGNEHVPSGDDEFLLRKIKKKYPSGVAFVKDALVKTEAVSSWSEFYHQRVRWSSKWRFHRDVFSLALPVLLFVLYFLGVLFSVLSWETDWLLVVLALLSKLTLDYIFVKKATRLSQTRMNPLVFLLLQIIYPLYVVFFGIASNFGRFRWRNRSYQI